MPNESAYIDTSVLRAYYCPELSSPTVEDGLRRVQSSVVRILSEVEFCSLISKKRRLRELTPRQAKEILDLFATHVAEGDYRRTVGFEICNVDSAPTNKATINRLAASLTYTKVVHAGARFSNHR